MSKKYVYLFSEGNATMRELLGGKGANLAEMTNIGLPVPQGFTITTEACTQYYEDGRKINDEIMAEIMEYVAKMEEMNGKKFGDLKNPLLVSVRSGARASMPGMMDTILNLGLNDDVVAAMIAGNPDPNFERFVYDSYRRFIQMFSDVVMEVGKKYFEQLIDAMKEKRGVKLDIELTAADLKELAEQFKAEYKQQIGEDFPSDPKTQLYEAIRAVFRSWDNPRANVYRRDNDIPYSWQALPSPPLSSPPPPPWASCRLWRSPGPSATAPPFPSSWVRTSAPVLRPCSPASASARTPGRWPLCTLPSTSSARRCA